MNRVIFFLLMICFCSACKKDVPVNQYHTKHVIVIVIDGPRWSETWGDQLHTNIPVRANELAPQGVLLTHIYNNGDTYTCPGHVALSTGRYQSITNDGTQMPDEPGVFQYFLQQTSLPSKQAWLITSKDKLFVLSNCVDPQWNNKFSPSFDCGIAGPFTGYREDSVTLKNALQILKTDSPALMFICFKEPDVSAHTGNWDNYIKGIQTTDQYVGVIWNYIQSSDLYKDKTTLIITNDHGRHLNNVSNGFISHGDTCEGCRHIEFLAMGPDFKKGITVDSLYDQTDVSATIAELLHTNMPTSHGKVISACFVNR